MGRVIIQQDFDQLETELQEARTQISGFQREQIRHDDEIVLARVSISTLEMIIEDIQVTMALLPPGFLEPLYPDMINNQDIEHMIPPTPPRDIEPPIVSPISLSPSSSVGILNLSNCTKECKVKFATGTLTEEALSWWNSLASLLDEEAYKTTGKMFQDLTLEDSGIDSFMPQNLVPNSEKLMEVFIRGLPRSTEGNITASKPQTLEEAITITQRLMDQVIKHNSVSEETNITNESLLIKKKP
ncbi:hypothetical protein Tco_1083104 [Tanacetum coccineum]|uniref:Reverse transcriptase domain-containing protein n=1 Tax=Tanacetum coccineum TaxID=301880 RepID=A0ABQ5I3K1_9ASTR